MEITSLYCELTWIRYLLNTFVINYPRATVMHCDNKVVMHITANLVFFKRTKHIGLNCHLTIERIQDGSVVTKHLSTKENNLWISL